MFTRPGDSGSGGTAGLIYAVFALSCGLLGYEVSLMRILLYASWHHFAFLVISVALLGFGASGTALSITRRWLVERSGPALAFLVLATAVSFPVATGLAQHIPVEARFVPALLARNVAWWVLYWAVLFVPFFVGAAAIGLSIIISRERLSMIYASNLAGSALGACVAPLAMRVVDPAWLSVMMGIIALSGVLPMRVTRIRAGVLVAIVIAGIFLSLSPPAIRTDPFKYERYVQDLVEEGRAAQEARAVGPRAIVEIYSGEAFHELAFLSGRETPPPMLAAVLDGHWAGSVLRVRDTNGAEIVDHTMMSVPYAFAPAKPSVLILGETGGANVWLALRQGACHVDVVQPNTQLLRLLRGDLRDKGGLVFDRPGVSVSASEPRHFVDHTRARFDLIQIASLESWAVATGGVAGLQQDHLVTIEGIEACLERLTPDGILSVCRAIETPPRDNAKILATVIEALRRSGADHPEMHIAIVRDFLAVCTMVRASPWTPDDIAKIRAVCAMRELTPVYFAGIRDDELNHPDELPGPPKETGDWLHHAAVSLFSKNAREFIDDWPFDIRPPTDDRPFFENFGKLKSIGILRQTFGDLWLTRTELGFLFVLGAIVLVAVSGFVLTLIPLWVRREIRCAPGRGATAFYFTVIGLGYMIVEITFFSRLIHLIGDPVLAGAVTIAAFLFFSGLGSFASRRIDPWSGAVVRRLILALAGVGMVVLMAARFVTTLAGSFALPWRLGVAVILIAPLAFLMGFPMPLGLRRLEKKEPVLLPWAWGVNGFASVLAPPIATAIGMTVGFRTAGIVAVISYALAAAAFGALPGLSKRTTGAGEPAGAHEG